MDNELGHNGQVARALKWLAGTLGGGIIVGVVWDVTFNDCTQTCGLFDSSPEYAFHMPVGDGRNGGPTSNYAIRLFERYKDNLKDGVQLYFDPEKTRNMLFCREFRRFSGSIDTVFDRFLRQYSECITRPNVGTNYERITIEPTWGSKKLAIDERGNFWCDCSDEVISAEVGSFRRAPMKDG